VGVATESTCDITQRTDGIKHQGWSIVLMNATTLRRTAIAAKILRRDARALSANASLGLASVTLPPRSH
jgi:hypothetical protein